MPATSRQRAFFYPGLIGERETEHLRRRLLCELQDFARVSVAVRRVGPADATVVSLESAGHAGRPLHEVSENAHPMTDVVVDREQITRRTTRPLTGVTRHHLHQSPGTDKTLRPPVEPGI